MNETDFKCFIIRQRARYLLITPSARHLFGVEDSGQGEDDMMESSRLRGGEMTEGTEVRRKRSGFVFARVAKTTKRAKSKREGKSARSDSIL